MDIKLYRKFDSLYYDPECTKEVKHHVSHGVKTFDFVDGNGYSRCVSLEKFKKLEYNGMVSFAPKSEAKAETTSKKSTTQSTTQSTQSDDAKKFLDDDEFALYNDLMEKIRARRRSYDTRKAAYNKMMESLDVLGISGDAAKPFIDNYIQTVGPIDPSWVSVESSND